MKSPKERKITTNNTALMVYEWGAASPRYPDIIFFHATGFHGHCWDQVIRKLPEFHIYAVDAQNHGKSARTMPAVGWHEYGQDVTELVRHLELKAAIGVGHSMGGNSLVRAAAALPSAFDVLLLVDPVILPKDSYTKDSYSIEGHFVLNRRREWESPATMFNSFKGRGPFINWEDAVLWDYCQYGLLPQGDAYVLACSPEVEAHIYASTSTKSGADIYDLLPQIEQRVRILRCATSVSEAGLDLMASPTAADLWTRFQHGEDVILPDNSHFIPMESPDLIAAHVRELAAQVGR